MFNVLARIRNGLSSFFFAEETPYGLALVRMTLPLVLLVGVLPRWWHARELYSTDGATSPLWLSYDTPAFLPELSATVAVGLYSVLVLCLLTASIGWRTRLSLGISLLLYAGFGITDMVSTLTKYTVLVSHVFLILTFSDCGSVWSIDAWRAGRRSSPLPRSRPKSPVWPRRLLMLLLGICYLGATFTKMHTPAFFSGDQMRYWMLANMNFANPLGEYMTLFPWFILVSGYLTILWEVLFIFFIWERAWRMPVLVFGVIFHLTSILLLGLVVFPLICLSLYLMFVDESDVERLAVWGRSQARRWKLMAARRSSVGRWNPPAWLGPQQSLAAFGLLVATVAVVGVEVEYRLDVYQERGVDGPLTLTPLDENRAAAMFGPELPLRPQDMFFAFDIGTTTLGGYLADHRRTFETGEQAIVQCSLNPPHPDMWVEVTLRDLDDRVIRKIGQIIPRELLRSNMTYTFGDELPIGSYQFVLAYDDVEIARRRFVLKPGTQASRTVSGLTAARR